MALAETPSSRAVSVASIVSVPWPIGPRPLATTTAPSGSTRRVQVSCWVHSPLVTK